MFVSQITPYIIYRSAIFIPTKSYYSLRDARFAGSETKPRWLATSSNYPMKVNFYTYVSFE